MIFSCGTRRAGRALVEAGHDVWHYQWNHHFEGWRSVASCDNLLFLCGNYHGSELTFVWQHHDDSLNKHDRDMNAIIGTYWTNFAKTGDPNKGIKASDITGAHVSVLSRDGGGHGDSGGPMMYLFTCLWFLSLLVVARCLVGAFAGDPNTETVFWEPFNHTAQAYMSLEVPNQAMGTGLWQSQCDLFDKFDGFPS